MTTVRVSIRVLLCSAACLLLGPLVAGASAAPPDNSGVVERGDGALGFIYWEGDHLVMYGTAEQFCASPTPPTGPGGTTVRPANGSTIEFTKVDVPVSVYEYTGVDATVDPSGGFAFLFANCAAIADGDPTTEPIEAVATGTVRLQARFRTDANGVTRQTNSMVGRLTTTDGESAHLNTYADFSFSETAPPELKTLRVNYSG